MKAVDSDHLDAVEYNPQSKVLSVRFKNGSVYQYAGVAEDQFKTLMAADSHGSYFAKNIKGKFKTRKVSG